MGLFKRKAMSLVVSMPRESLDVVGESHYQKALISIAGPKTVEGHHNIPLVITPLRKALRERARSARTKAPPALPGRNGTFFQKLLRRMAEIRTLAWAVPS